jgi:hypothetical protein
MPNPATAAVAPFPAAMICTTDDLLLLLLLL